MTRAPMAQYYHWEALRGECLEPTIGGRRTR